MKDNINPIDLEKELKEIDDLDLQSDLELEEGEDPSFDFGYQMGYDTGYLDGFEEGQKQLAFEKESEIHNNLLDEVINHIDKISFQEKDGVMSILQLLRRI